MRVLFVCANRTLMREDIYHPAFPLGMAVVAAATRQAGHEVSCLDLAFRKDVEATIRRRVEAFKPDVVGLSIRNTLNFHFSLVPCLERTVAAIRAATEAPLVAGGGAFTELAADLMEALGLRYGVLGDGEETFPAILERMAAGRTFDDLPGVAVVRGGEFRSNGIRRPTEMDRFAPPARDLFDTAVRYPIMNFYAKRGMPKWTQFRSSYLIEGGDFRPRSVALVVEELESLVASGHTDFYLVDEIANEPADYYDALFDRVIAAGLGERINLDMVVRASLVTPERFERLLRGGLKFLEMEVDSLSPRLLERLQGPCTVADYERVSRLCEQAGCPYNYYMFVGGPAEDMETARETFRRLDELDPTVVLLLDSLPLDPASALLPRARAEGVVPPGHDLLRYPVFYNPPAIRDQREEYVRLLDDLFGRHPLWSWSRTHALKPVPDHVDDVARTDVGEGCRPLDDDGEAALAEAVAKYPAVIREFIARGARTLAWRMAQSAGQQVESLAELVPRAVAEALPRVLRKR
jgi:radical SAM superfamily enzyme YgiQ (UPF0313 family)